jgi:hypothetical protein
MTTLSKLDRDEMLEFELKWLNDSEDAILFTDETDDNNGRRMHYWLPKKYTEYEMLSNAGYFRVRVPAWLAYEKGLL